jgi:hypothetical protein
MGCPRFMLLAASAPGPCSTIFGNNFDGLIPDSWAQFGNLQDVIATPGNPALCPAAPLGASFSVCSAHDPLCINSLPTDTEACTALAPVTPSSTSSFPVAAVAAPLAVAAALAVVVAGLLWRRRTRRRSADLASARAKADLPVQVCVPLAQPSQEGRGRGARAHVPARWFMQDEEAGGVLALRSKQGGSAPSGPGAGAAAATVTPPGGWQAATHAGTVGDWLPGLSLQGSRSAEVGCASLPHAFGGQAWSVSTSLESLASSAPIKTETLKVAAPPAWNPCCSWRRCRRGARLAGRGARPPSLPSCPSCTSPLPGAPYPGIPPQAAAAAAKHRPRGTHLQTAVGLLRCGALGGLHCSCPTGRYGPMRLRS